MLSARLEHLIADGVVVRTPGCAEGAREEHELDAAGFCATCGVTPEPRDILLPARDSAGMTDPVSLAMTRPHRLLEPLAV